MIARALILAAVGAGLFAVTAIAMREPEPVGAPMRDGRPPDAKVTFTSPHGSVEATGSTGTTTEYDGEGGGVMISGDGPSPLDIEGAPVLAALPGDEVTIAVDLPVDSLEAWTSDANGNYMVPLETKDSDDGAKVVTLPRDL